MKDYENSKVKCLLAELNRIITHAENAIPNVGNSNNQRWEEINFEQLTRDSESRLNVLKREVHAITDIEIINAAAEDTSTVLNRFQKFDKGTICKIEDQLKAAKIELENAINEKVAFQAELNNEPFITTDSQPSFLEALAHWGKALVERKIQKKIDSSIHDSKNKINNYTQFIERFEQITAEFRVVLRRLNDIQQMLLEKIERFNIVDVEEITTNESNNKEANKKVGRNREKWYGEKWENLNEEEVERRMKQAYDATSSKLSELKAEKNIAGKEIYNAVWAAVYFYAAEKAKVVASPKKANCIDFIRGLYKLGINCNKGTVLKYYTIVKAFLIAITELDSDLPTVCQLIEIAKEEKNTQEYPETRKWLRKDDKLVTLSDEINRNNKEDNKESFPESNIMFVAKNLQILKKIHNMMYSHFSC